MEQQSPNESAAADKPSASATEEDGSRVPEDAFIDPDEPIVRDDSPIADDAFIDPDEPIVRTRPPAKPEDFEEVVRGASSEGGDDDFDPDEVVVTGIGDDPHLDELKAVRQYGDRFVSELVEKVGFLADQLRSRGEAGLRTDPDMSRFEASLRAYCTGYLAGRREGREE